MTDARTVLLFETIASIDAKIGLLPKEACAVPVFEPAQYFETAATSKYVAALALMRHALRQATEHYFASAVGAVGVDLFMFTSSVSSPMGPGSDSEAIPFTLGALETYLVDSSQFGFEPLVLNGLEQVYCYLPSMRGEKPDARHLNQFYHCEYEGRGGLADAMAIAEGYVQALAAALRNMPNAIERLSSDPQATARALAAIAAAKEFDRMRFSDAAASLSGGGIRATEHGRDITSAGELSLLRARGSLAPMWLTHFDRDRVAFYQKPDPQDPGSVLNADLLFLPIAEGAFGGEIVGLGQRQDTPEEIAASLARQNIDAAPYEWYIQLRRMPGYLATSGFGLGIERFIAWALGLATIRDAALYPRLRDIPVVP